MSDTETRLIRGCDLCGGVDSDPRHVTWVTEGGVPGQDVVDKLLDNGLRGSGFSEVMDPTTVVRHFDCDADAGCEVCKTALGDAPKSARHGVALIAHLTKEA